MPDPKVQPQSSPALAVPRPLRTGRSFTVVLPKKRILYRHWDKEVYLPGEEAALIVESEGNDGEKYELILEKAPSEDGPWEQVTSLEAKADGGRAKAKYKFPKPEPKGRLTKAEWKRRRAEPGDRLGLHVEAQGCEGAFLSIRVEKQQEDGSWETYTRWQGKIESGKYDGVFVVPPRRGKAREDAARPAGRVGKIVELSFERDPLEGGRAWMRARVQDLDSTQIKFVLERADDRGNWVEIGSAVATVGKGAARNSVPVPALPDQKPAAQETAPRQFAIARLHKSNPAVDQAPPTPKAGQPAQGPGSPASFPAQTRAPAQVQSPPVATQPQPLAPSAPTAQPTVATRPPPGPPAPVATQPRPAASPPAVAIQPEAPAPIPPQPARPHSGMQPQAMPGQAPVQTQAPPPSGAQPQPTVGTSGTQPTAAAPATVKPQGPSPAGGKPSAQPTPATPVAQAPIAPRAPPPVQAIPTPVQAMPTPVPIPMPVQAVPPPVQAVPMPAQTIASPPLSAAAPTPPPTPPASPSGVGVPSADPNVGSAASGTFTPADTAAGPAIPGAPAADARSLPSLADAPSAPGGDSFSDPLSKVRKAKEQVQDTADKLADARKKIDELAPADDASIEE